MPAPARVLHVLTDNDRRGAQIFGVDLSAALQASGWVSTVRVLTDGSSGGLDLASLGPSRMHRRTLLSLRDLAREHDIVIAHGSTTLQACGTALIGTGVPWIYRNISDPAYWMATTARRLQVAPFLHRADGVVPLWEGGAAFLEAQLGLRRDRMKVIPNAVNESAFHVPTHASVAEARSQMGLPHDATVLVYMAALKPEKHPLRAVEILRQLPKDVRLLIAGDGPLLNATKRAAHDFDGRIQVLGQVNDPATLLACADVFLLPTEGEGLPAVLIEAGLSGLASVASDSGGNSDIVVDGRTGRIVASEDPRAFAEAVLQVWPHRRAMGMKAREHCLRRFGLGQVAAQWDAFMRLVLERRGDRSKLTG